MAKPKIIVDNQKSGSIEVCCESNCVEVEVKGTTGSTSTPTSSQPAGTTAAPSGSVSTETNSGQTGTTVAPPGGRTVFTQDPLGIGATQFVARYGIESFEQLLERCSQIHHAWSSQKWRLDNGAFIFDIRNISRIDLSKIGAVTQL